MSSNNDNNVTVLPTTATTVESAVPITSTPLPPTFTSSNTADNISSNRLSVGSDNKAAEAAEASQSNRDNDNENNDQEEEEEEEEKEENKSSNRKQNKTTDDVNYDGLTGLFLFIWRYVAGYACLVLLLSWLIHLHTTSSSLKLQVERLNQSLSFTRNLIEYHEMKNSNLEDFKMNHFYLSTSSTSTDIKKITSAYNMHIYRHNTHGYITPYSINSMVTRGETVPYFIYKKKAYQFIPIPMTFDQADAHAKSLVIESKKKYSSSSLTGKLATVSSYDEHAFLTDVLSYYLRYHHRDFQSSYTSPFKCSMLKNFPIRVWMGATDREEEGVWHWLGKNESESSFIKKKDVFIHSFNRDVDEDYLVMEYAHTNVHTNARENHKTHFDCSKYYDYLSNLDFTMMKYTPVRSDIAVPFFVEFDLITFR